MYYNMIHNMGVEHKVDSKTGEVGSLGGFMFDLEECVLRGLVGEGELMAWGMPLPEVVDKKPKGKDEEKDEKEGKEQKDKDEIPIPKPESVVHAFLKD